MKTKACKKCGGLFDGPRCMPCLKARMAESYEKNKDSRRAKSAAWRIANPEKVRAASAAYRAQQHEKVLAATSVWREANPEKSHAWRKNNPERMRELRAAWLKANPEACAVNYAKRRARKINATPAWFAEFDDFAICEAYHLARKRKQTTGFPWHVDHVVPLMGKRVCGLHIAANLAVIPATLNVKKGNRFTCGEGV